MRPSSTTVPSWASTRIPTRVTATSSTARTWIGSGGLELGIWRQLAPIADGQALQEEALAHAPIGVEVDRRVEPVPQAVDVRGVDVLAREVRVLEEQAQHSGIVRRLGLAERREHPADLTAGERGLVGRAGTEDESLENGLTCEPHLGRGRTVGHFPLLLVSAITAKRCAWQSP
jgi:hypothetical protein